MMPKVAEFQARVGAEVRKSENVFLHLRVNFCNRLGLVRFRPIYTANGRPFARFSIWARQGSRST